MEQFSQEEFMSNTSTGSGTDKPLRFKAGSVIFGQGKPSKYLYIVLKGEVILLKVKGSSCTAIELCGEKDILNEVSVLTSTPNDLTAIAKTDVELVLVHQQDVVNVIKNSPTWIPDIFKTLCERLKHTQQMIDEHNLAREKDVRLIITKDDEKKYTQALADFISGN